MDTKELETTERVVFATLVAYLVKGELPSILKDAPREVCEEFGRVWDKHSSVPVGTLFQRPNFEGK